MKRHFKGMLALVLLFLLAVGPCATALAADGWQRVELPELGMSLLLPEENDLFTRNMPEDAPALARSGMTAEALDEFFVSEHLFLDSVLPGGSKEIVLKVLDVERGDFRTLDEAALASLASEMVAEIEEAGIAVEKYDLYQGGTIPFFRVWGRSQESAGHAVVCYYTSCNGRRFHLVLHSYVGSLSPADEEMMLKVANSVVFQKASDAPAQAAVQTDPSEFQYIVRDDQTAQITNYTGQGSAVAIPETLGGYPVTSIENLGWGSQITSVAIPASVTEIENTVFFMLDSDYLQAISVADGNKAFAAVDGVLYSADRTRLICHPPQHANKAYSVPKETKVIGSFAFYYCQNLESVELPDGVETIEQNAFALCSFAEIHLPQSIQQIDGNPFECNYALTSISVDPQNPHFYSQDGVLYSRADKKLQAFPSNKDIDSFSIPDGIVAIGEDAFLSDVSKRTIIFPKSLKHIEGFAFWGCRDFVFPDLPEELASIGAFAFSECRSLVEVTIPRSAEIEMGAFSSCSRLQRVSVQNGVTSISDGLFTGCSALRDVSLPSTLVSIGERAFEGCESLTELAIPASVTSIGEKAFEDCPNLTLYVAQGSYAEEYCRANDLRYVFSGAAEQADPKAVYTDPISGITFLIPQGWEQVELTKAKHAVEVMFVPQMLDAMIEYRCTDIWGTLEEDDPELLRSWANSRTAMDNDSMLTIADAAQLYEVEKSAVHRTTYAGQEYYVIQKDVPMELDDGTELVVKATVYTCVKNGLHHSFMYYQLADDVDDRVFMELLSSIEY